VIGIDLWDEDPAGDVPTQNDELDLDTGLGNRAQNFPVLYHVFYDQSAITVSGVLHSRPNRAYFIDLYADSVGSLAESGQGEKFLRTIVVKTDVNGDALFDIFAPGFLPADYFLTATATPVAPAPFGDTSEFSPLLAIEDPNGAMAAGLAATAASADASVVTEAPPPAGRLASDQTTRPAIHPHTYRPRAGHSRAGLAAAARAGHGHPGLLRWFR
jgi:hypothetical protein